MTYDVIVVGGGIAGLTATAYLARDKKKVLLIDKNKECGGLVNTFEKDGFRFDAGVRALLNAGIIKPMLEDLGIELNFLRSYVSLGIENEILNIDNIENLETYRKMLEKFFPDSKKEIDWLLEEVRRIMKHVGVLYGVTNPAFKNVLKDKDYLFRELLPWLPRFLFTIGKIYKMDTPVEEYLEKHISNSSLRDIVSQHFFRGVPAFFALSYFSFYLDYLYPRGGVGKLADALVRKVEDYGGVIKQETLVTSVNLGEKVLFDSNGNSYHYDFLIWAADLKTFYRIADPQGLNLKLKRKFEEAKKKILAGKGGDSVYTLFLGVDEPPESFSKLSHGHFFYAPKTIGLGQIHRLELKKMLANWDNVKKENLFEWLDRFLDLNSYEISIPSLKDPDMSPPGKTGLIISFLTDYELFKKVFDRGWYEEFVGHIESKIVEIFTVCLYPFLKEKIIFKFSFTPISIEKRIASSEGAITGWSFEEPIPVVNKIHKSTKSVLTPLPYVFQAGQWTYSPSGVPIAILTGKLAADAVLKKLR